MFFDGSSQNFARLAPVLNLTLQKVQLTMFGLLNDKETQSMYALKQALKLSPGQPLLNTTSHMTLDTVACIAQVGFVLQRQKQLETFKAIAYCSWFIKNGLNNHDTT